MPLPQPFHNPPQEPRVPQPPEPPFVIRVEHLDVSLGGYFRPAAHVSFASPLRTSGLLAALPPEAVKDLLLLLTFVTPNGHCAPTVRQIAQAMRVSPGKARSRLERLEALRWQARPLLWHGTSESGLEFFSPLSALAPVREEAKVPSAYVPPPPIRAAPREAVIAHSRATYARPRAEVEAQIEEMMGYRKAHQSPKPPQAAVPMASPATTPAQRTGDLAEVPLPAPSPEEAEALREQEAVRELLQQAGLDAEQAEGLLEHYDLVRIRRQLMWLPYRRAKNPAGMLLAAVKDDYEAPQMTRHQPSLEQLGEGKQAGQAVPPGPQSNPVYAALDAGEEVILHPPPLEA